MEKVTPVLGRNEIGLLARAGIRKSSVTVSMLVRCSACEDVKRVPLDYVSLNPATKELEGHCYECWCWDNLVAFGDAGPKRALLPAT